MACQRSVLPGSGAHIQQHCAFIYGHSLELYLHVHAVLASYRFSLPQRRAIFGLFDKFDFEEGEWLALVSGWGCVMWRVVWGCGSWDLRLVTDTKPGADR